MRLLTRPGERLMRPEFGAGIRSFIHHPNNETTRALIADAAQEAAELPGQGAVATEPAVGAEKRILEEAGVLPQRAVVPAACARGGALCGGAGAGGRCT